MKLFCFKTVKKIKIILMLLFCLPMLSMDLGEDRDSAEKRRRQYWREKKLLESVGYTIERRPAVDSDFTVSFPPIQRSQQELDSLKAWGFQDDETRWITIRNIYDPLSDERIRRANRPDIGHPLYRLSFRIFASRLLWPYNEHEINEADMLLLIPWLRSEDINVRLPRRTLFHIAVALNYRRVVQLLLADKELDVNKDDGEHKPLETAITMREKCASHDEIVALLLNSGRDFHISERTRKLAANTGETISALIKEYAQKKAAPSITPQTDAWREKMRAKYGIGAEATTDTKASLSSSGVPVASIQAVLSGVPTIPTITIPVKKDLLAKYAKLHAKFMDAAEKRGDNIPVEPPHRGIKPFIAWAVGVPVVAAALKYGHDFYDKYYGSGKKKPTGSAS